MKIYASTANLADVRDFVAEHANRFGFSDREVSNIRLAVDEACTNIIKHAYDFDENQTVVITVSFEGNQIRISLLDHGLAFNPDTYSKPDLQKQMIKKKRGGVGVYLIRKLMDEVIYMKTKNGNEIRMYKKRS
ncbi:MAG: ATP-binding protein [Balneolaceae bacterium]